MTSSFTNLQSLTLFVVGRFSLVVRLSFRRARLSFRRSRLSLVVSRLLFLACRCSLVECGETHLLFLTCFVVANVRQVRCMTSGVCCDGRLSVCRCCGCSRADGHCCL